MGASESGWSDPLDEQPPERPPGDSAVVRALVPVGRSGWAIAAGYLGLLAVLLVPAPLAVLAGVLAVRDIRRHPRKHGLVRAGFGIVAGLLGTLFLALWLVDLATAA